MQYNQVARQQSKQKNSASSSTPQSHDALALIRNQWHLFVNRGANKLISMNEKTGFAANELPVTLLEHGQLCLLYFKVKPFMKHNPAFSFGIFGEAVSW